jgi:hypothetical protein
MTNGFIMTTKCDSAIRKQVIPFSPSTNQRGKIIISIPKENWLNKEDYKHLF